MGHNYTDNSMKKILKEWNASAKHNDEKLKPNMRKWKKGLFGWTWIGEGARESYGSWVTYSGTKTIQTGIQDYDTISETVYIWEGPEPPGGRPPRPDLTPEAESARIAKQMNEAAERAQFKRNYNADIAQRSAQTEAAEADAAARARKEKYNSCIADFGPFQQEYTPISGGTRKKRKNSKKKKRTRRYVRNVKCRS
jgi:hypothetical protein